MMLKRAQDLSAVISCNISLMLIENLLFSSSNSPSSEPYSPSLLTSLQRRSLRLHSIRKIPYSAIQEVLRIRS